MRSPICSAALAAAALTLAGCVTGGMDAETKAALRTTMESIQELTELWQERLDALDGGEDAPTDAPDVEGIELVGSATLTSYSLIGGRTEETWSFTTWGVTGRTAEGEHLFSATVSGANIPGGSSPHILDPYSPFILGLRSFDNPTGYGTATWTGNVRAYETDLDTYGTPVEGDAELTMDLDGVLDTIDLDFTSFDRGHSDMSWNSVFVSLGGFRSFLYGDLEGEFYGDEHEGVAGTFERDSLKGVFGALRD